MTVEGIVAGVRRPAGGLIVHPVIVAAAGQGAGSKPTLGQAMLPSQEGPLEQREPEQCEVVTGAVGPVVGPCTPWSCASPVPVPWRAATGSCQMTRTV